MTYPNLGNKHSEDSMVSPAENLAYRRRTGRLPNIAPPTGAILCYQRSLLAHMLESHAASRLEGFMGDIRLLKETGDRIAVAGGFGVGAPAAVLVLEELAAFGVTRFMSIGTAGTLQKDVGIGHLVVCDRAIRDEGTSHHYMKHSKYAHATPEMTQRIIASLKRSRRRYTVGTSWTIDAPYRETVAEATQYQREGVITVEMEASALFTVAKYRNAEIGAIFAISDSLAELEWEPKFHLRRTSRSLETLYRVALDVLLGD